MNARLKPRPQEKSGMQAHNTEKKRFFPLSFFRMDKSIGEDEVTNSRRSEYVANRWLERGDSLGFFPSSFAGNDRQTTVTHAEFIT